MGRHSVGIELEGLEGDPFDDRHHPVLAAPWCRSSQTRSPCAFLAVHGTHGAPSPSVRETVDGLTKAVAHALLHSDPAGAPSTSKTCRTKSSWASYRSLPNWSLCFRGSGRDLQATTVVPEKKAKHADCVKREDQQASRVLGIQQDHFHEQPEVANPHTNERCIGDVRDGLPVKVHWCCRSRHQAPGRFSCRQAQRLVMSSTAFGLPSRDLEGFTRWFDQGQSPVICCMECQPT